MSIKKTSIKTIVGEIRKSKRSCLHLMLYKKLFNCEMIIFLSTYIDSITSGIIGSLIAGFMTIGIVEGHKYYNLYIHQKQFKKIFGTYNNEKLHLVIPALTVRQDIINTPGYEYPLIKSGGIHIKSSKLLAFADMVSLKYIIDIIATTLGSKSVIMTDEEMQNQLDTSFISFGGSSFYCSFVLNESNNKYYTFNGSSIISKQTPSKIFQSNQIYDYGFIIKYKHENFPKRTWIIIAGLGETGTRGAGWFLSNHWKQLSEQLNDKPFGLLIQVNQGIDNSAVEVDRIT